MSSHTFLVLSKSNLDLPATVRVFSIDVPNLTLSEPRVMLRKLLSAQVRSTVGEKHHNGVVIKVDMQHVRAAYGPASSMWVWRLNVTTARPSRFNVVA